MQHKPRPLSNQDAFNNVWQHFIVERHDKAAAGPMCLYRTEDGQNGCALGCQIPDEFIRRYQLVSRNPDAASLLDTDPEITQYFIAVNEELLVLLQGAHDNKANQWDTWGDGAPLVDNESTDFHTLLTRRMHFIAGKFALTIPE